MRKPFAFRIWIIYHIINSMMEIGKIHEYVGDDIAPIQDALARTHYEGFKYLRNIDK